MKNEITQQLVKYAVYGKHFQEIIKFRFGHKKLSPIRFVIFGRGRSGSTALVSLLDSLPNLYCDGEILNQPVPSPYSHVLARCGNSKSDIYGCKILSYQIKDVQPIDDREGFIHRLHDNNFKIIYLKRENLIFHALSNIRARKFGFHNNKEKHNHGKITIDLDHLLKWMKGSEELDTYEKLLLKDFQPLSLTYEKHLLNSENHQSTVKLVTDYLGVECGTAKTNYRKLSPKKLQDSVANYHELVSFLDNTPYAKYLD